jgi:hypothetical protein
VTAETRVGVAISVVAVLGVGGDGSLGSTIAEEVVTGVLEDELTLVVGVTTLERERKG